jgi:hypothetical protein
MADPWWSFPSQADVDTDCIYMPPTSHGNGLNVWNKIMHITKQELAPFRPNKCYQYAKVHIFWYVMQQDFVEFCHRYHLCQVNKIPTKVTEGVPRPMPIPNALFESLALDLAGPLPSDQKGELILVVLDHFSGCTYLLPVSENIDAKKTAQILSDKIFTIH